MNPNEGEYCWVGLDDCQVAVLQDLRWTPELIQWRNFLTLLEDQTVSLAQPKKLYATDMAIPKANTISSFASTKQRLVFKESNCPK